MLIQWHPDENLKQTTKIISKTGIINSTFSDEKQSVKLLVKWN